MIKLLSLTTKYDKVSQSQNLDLINQNYEIPCQIKIQ